MLLVKKTVIAIAVGNLVCQGSNAATIDVNASCSLVDAILSAENDQATNGCVAGAGDDTIILETNSSHVFTEGFDNNGDETTALPVITSNINLIGNGSSISRDSNADDFRLFRVANGGDLTLQATNVSGGGFGTDTSRLLRQGACLLAEASSKLNLSDTTVSSCYIRGAGGAISVLGGSELEVTNSAFIGNRSISVGGALSISEESIATILDSEITENDSLRGTIFVEDSSVEVVDSKISGNEALYGGGINSWSSTVIVTGSTISNNEAQYYGGGIAARDSNLTIANSTIHNNSTTYRYTRGGGVWVYGGNATIVNSTISNNLAPAHPRGYLGPGEGGGIYNHSGSIDITNTTIFENKAVDGAGISSGHGGEITLKNSIVAGDGRVATGFGDQRVTRSQCSTENTVFSFNDDTIGTVIAGSDSIIEDGTCNTTALTVDPMLGPLANNGGSTYTHELLAGSPAINIGKLSFCQTPALNGRDQRSFIHRGLCDAGSYEFRDSSSIGADGFFIGPLFLLLEDDD